jgi:hypothetical protein
MTKSNKEKEPEKIAQKSKPSFGLISLILILAGIAVFALTRNKQYEPPQEQREQASVPAQPQEQPAPQETTAQESTIPQESTSPQESAVSQQQEPDHSTDVPIAEQVRIPAFFENPDLAEPLNPVLAPESVPYHAQFGYKAVQRKPRLMAQMPCFCYCDKFGHTSLHTCFETTHAIGCDICLKEAIDADRMDSEGMSPQEIREVIIQQYKEHGHDHS